MVAENNKSQVRSAEDVFKALREAVATGKISRASAKKFIKALKACEVQPIQIANERGGGDFFGVKVDEDVSIHGITQRGLGNDVSSLYRADAVQKAVEELWETCANNGKKVNDKRTDLDPTVDASLSQLAGPQTKTARNGAEFHAFDMGNGVSAYGVTKKGQTVPGHYNQDQVTAIIDTLTKAIAKNGQEVVKPKEKRKRSGWLWGLLIALVVTLILSKGISCNLQNNKASDAVTYYTQTLVVGIDPLKVMDPVTKPSLDVGGLEQIQEIQEPEEQQPAVQKPGKAYDVRKNVRKTAEHLKYYKALWQTKASVINSVVEEITKGQFVTLDEYIKHLDHITSSPDVAYLDIVKESARSGEIFTKCAEKYHQAEMDVGKEVLSKESLQKFIQSIKEGGLDGIL